MWTDNDFGDPRADDMTELTQRLMRCATLIEQADGLLITAGAGIGVDTGLPDFRGNEGFWRAYPAWDVRGYSFRTLPVLRPFGRTLGWRGASMVIG